MKEEQSSENFISGLSSRDSGRLHSSAAPADEYQQIEAFQSPRGAPTLRDGGPYLARAGFPGGFGNFLNTIGNEWQNTTSSHPTHQEKC